MALATSSAALARRVRRLRLDRRRVLARGQRRRVAVHRGARREDEAIDPRSNRRLEHRRRPLDVHDRVPCRIGERRAHAREAGEVNHRVGPRDSRVDRRAVGHARRVNRDAVAELGAQIGAVPFLVPHRIRRGAEVVDDYDVVAPREERAARVIADEADAARDENAHDAIASRPRPAGPPVRRAARRSPGSEAPLSSRPRGATRCAHRRPAAHRHEGAS